jgi:hypothetical protein
MSRVAPTGNNKTYAVNTGASRRSLGVVVNLNGYAATTFGLSAKYSSRTIIFW